MGTVLSMCIAIFVATMFGGVFALRFKDKLHLVMGFSAGALIGVALFDLMPEAFALTPNYHGIGSPVAIAIGSGFFAYFVLDRLNILHSHDKSESENIHRWGILGAISLSLHSVLDGFIVGLARRTAPEIGAIVALAILGHRFSDGINVATIVLRGGSSRARALRWLLTVALTPALGIAAAFILPISENSLAPVLGICCGFFLYLGASDLLPESHHEHPGILTTFMTLFGVVTLYVVTRIAG